MKINIITSDNALRCGVRAIADRVSVKGVRCEGSLTIIDLMYPELQNVTDFPQSCHIIFLTDEEMVFRMTEEVSFLSDTRHLSRRSTAVKIENTIVDIIVSVMQKKCYWTGVLQPLPYLSEPPVVFTQAQKKLLLLIQAGASDMRIPEKYSSHPKTLSGRKTILLKKTSTKNLAQLRKLLKQKVHLSDFAESQKRSDALATQSPVHICRHISQAHCKSCLGSPRIIHSLPGG